MRFVEWVEVVNEKRWQVINMYQFLASSGKWAWRITIGFCGKFYAESKGEGRTAALALRRAFEGRKSKLKLYKRLYKQTVPGLRDSKYKSGEYKDTLRKLGKSPKTSKEDRDDDRPIKRVKVKLKKKHRR